MLRRFGSGNLEDDTFGGEEVNPMSGISTLADAMLVLAVGIMLALVINWNIDVGSSSVTEIDKSQMSELEDYDAISDDDLSEITGDKGLQEKGSVYVDPDTGKMYVVVNEK